MSDSSSSSSGGIGLCGMVFIVFLILKLAEYGPVAAWSWWAITAPLWAPIGIAIVVGVGALVIAGMVSALRL